MWRAQFCLFLSKSWGLFTICEYTLAWPKFIWRSQKSDFLKLWAVLQSSISYCFLIYWLLIEPREKRLHHSRRRRNGFWLTPYRCESFKGLWKTDGKEKTSWVAKDSKERLFQTLFRTRFRVLYSIYIRRCICPKRFLSGFIPICVVSSLFNDVIWSCIFRGLGLVF